MNELVPLADVRAMEPSTRDAFVREAAVVPYDRDALPLDQRGRRMHDLRISVTDRCNFRCVYCMPKDVFGRDYEFLPRAELLTFEEIERIARAAVELGVTKLRITGGEPLARREVERLVAMLAPLPADLTLTTN